MADLERMSGKELELVPPGHKFQQPPTPQKTEKKPCRDNFYDFMMNTTLHGFRYTMDKKLSWCERLYWVVCVACSMAVFAFYVYQLWDKWERTPVIVSFADTSNSVWSVPFPAVTICTETKPRQTKFNFTYAAEMQEQWKSDPNRKKEYEMYKDMLLVCNNANIDGDEFGTPKAIDTILEVAPPMSEVFLKCLWKGLDCGQMFYRTLTKDGVCFTFNMLAEQELFNTDNLHNDYHHSGGSNKSEWSLAEGYNDNASNLHTYPLRGKSYGAEEFEVILLTDLRDIDFLCRGPVQGFKVWIHNPAELPNMGQNFFRLPIKHQSAAAILPELVDTSEGLKSMPPEKRRCYFPSEKTLKYFRTYTQRNCELECASDYILNHCGCVPFYMPHGPKAKICGGKKIKCILEARELLSLLTKGDDPNNKSCSCLQACIEIKYEVEVSQAIYDNPRYFKETQNDHIVPSGLILYFSEDLFTSLQRSELYGSLDFVANCGGVAGLFLGFSFLSLVEIFYYSTIKLCCLYRRRRSIAIADQ